MNIIRGLPPILTDSYKPLPCRRMVLDWSVLMNMNWHKMRSPNFEARTGIEIQEFARNLVTHVLYLVERVQPDELILAVDAYPNWRSEVYSRYYRHHVEFLKYREKSGIWVVRFDRKTFLVTYRPEMDKWEYSKLPKKDVEASELEDPTQWERWSPVQIEPGSLADPRLFGGEPMPHVRDSPDWPALDHIIPRYKGNRATSRWEYETPRDEFKALGSNLAFNVAGTLGGHAVRVALAEADDICAAFVNTAPDGDEVVLVTIDTDLHQLLIGRPDLRIFDPVKHRWVDKSPERAKYELTHKILTGDSADNICGISLRGAAQTLGDKTAEKLIEGNGGPDGIWEYLQGVVGPDGRKVREGQADAAPLDRNLELIALSAIPAEIEHVIQDALLAVAGVQPVEKFHLTEFGLRAADIMSTRTLARLDKEIDDGVRDGDPIDLDHLGKTSHQPLDK